MKKIYPVLGTALASALVGTIASELLFTSSLYAQTMVGQSGFNSSNSMPLSQQALLEMQSNCLSITSGSVQFLNFGKNVTVTPIENIKSALTWISNIDQQADQVQPEDPLSQTITNFREQQQQQLKQGASTPFLNKPSANLLKSDAFFSSSAHKIAAIAPPKTLPTPTKYTRKSLEVMKSADIRKVYQHVVPTKERPDQNKKLAVGSASHETMIKAILAKQK